MKIDNNTVAIVGVIVIASIAIILTIRIPDNEIATGLIALGSTAIGGVIGYLAKSQIPDNEFITKIIDALKNDAGSDEISPSDNTDNNQCCQCNKIS